MNWHALLVSYPELGDRVYHLKEPPQRPDGLWALTEPDPDGAAEALVGAATGLGVVNLTLWQPRQLGRAGEDATDLTNLKAVAHRFWLEAPRLVTQDITDHLAVPGSFRCSRPHFGFDRESQQYWATLELRFQVFAPLARP